MACSPTRQPKLRERRARATLVVNPWKRIPRRPISSARSAVRHSRGGALCDDPKTGEWRVRRRDNQSCASSATAQLWLSTVGREDPLEVDQQREVGSSALASWRASRRPGGPESGVFADLTTKVARAARPRNFGCQPLEEDTRLRAISSARSAVGTETRHWRSFCAERSVSLKASGDPPTR